MLSHNLPWVRQICYPCNTTNNFLQREVTGVQVNTKVAVASCSYQPASREPLAQPVTQLCLPCVPRALQRNTDIECASSWGLDLRLCFQNLKYMSFFFPFPIFSHNQKPSKKGYWIPVPQAQTSVDILGKKRAFLINFRQGRLKAPLGVDANLST